LVGRDWPVDGLEFLNSAGTHRFRFSQPVAGGPVLLLQARANDEKGPFESVGEKPDNAIPVLSLLALHAEKTLDGLHKGWIYDVVWGEKGLDWRARTYSSNVNNVEQIIPKLRELVGRDTIETVRRGYRLTVTVRRVPAMISPLLPETGSDVPPPSPPIDGTESQKLASEGSLGPAEIRAEQRTGLARLEPTAPQSIRLGPILRLALSLTSFILFMWMLLRHPSPYLMRGVRYGFVTFAIFLATIVVAAVVHKLVTRRKRPKNKIVIYVARLGTDKLSEDTRELLIDSIRTKLDPAAAEVRTRNVLLKVTEEGEDQAKHEAARFLKKKDGDVLIWGKVYVLPQMKARVALRFATQGGYYRPDGKFGIADDTYLLDTTFGPELGTVVAAVAASMAFPSVRDAGTFLSAVLKPAADRLARLLGDLDHMYAVDRGCLLHSYGQIQLVIGDESGEEAPIKEAEAALRAATTELSRKRLPLLWALAQNSLGHALLIMGEREVGTERLKEAIVAFRAASDEWSGSHVDGYRTMPLNNLGLALRVLGERENGSESLKLSVDTLRAALEEGPPNDTSLRPAIVLNNIGSSLMRLGQREGEGGRAKEAVATLRRALEMLDRTRDPLHWSMTKNNLAIALTSLCERETQPQLLAEAAAAFRAAADVRTRNRLPLKWAAIQVNLGGTLVRLAELDSDTPVLHEAVKVTRAALDIPLRDRDPFLWATAQNTLGLALMKLGDCEENIEQLKEADKALQSALEEWKRERVPPAWAMATNNRAFTLMFIGQREASRERLEEAVARFRDAAEVCTRHSDRLNWVVAQNGLGLALLSLGILEPGAEHMEEAVATYRAVLEELTPEQSRELIEGTREGLEQALSVLRERIGVDGPEVTDRTQE
jgi:tetratricopeptide (TPR) repeat protein